MRTFCGDFMNILICDDEERCIRELKYQIEGYFKLNPVNPKFYISTHPAKVMDSDVIFDIAFLDIQMPEVNGITLAKELKRRNSKVILFMVTNYDEYQDDAMDLQIFRFFEKPFDLKRLYNGLDKALEFIDRSTVNLYVFGSAEQKCVNLDDIVYIKSDGRKTKLFGKDGTEYGATKPLSEWEKTLPQSQFYSTHKSFIVNLHYITHYSYKELCLNNDIKLPIASRKQAAFHSFWFDYIKNM